MLNNLSHLAFPPFIRPWRNWVWVLSGLGLPPLSRIPAPFRTYATAFRVSPRHSASSSRVWRGSWSNTSANSASPNFAGLLSSSLTFDVSKSPLLTFYRLQIKTKSTTSIKFHFIGREFGMVEAQQIKLFTPHHMTDSDFIGHSRICRGI